MSILVSLFSRGKRCGTAFTAQLISDVLLLYDPTGTNADNGAVSFSAAANDADVLDYGAAINDDDDDVSLSTNAHSAAAALSCTALSRLHSSATSRVTAILSTSASCAASAVEL